MDTAGEITSHFDSVSLSETSGNVRAQDPAGPGPSPRAPHDSEDERVRTGQDDTSNLTAGDQKSHSPSRQSSLDRDRAAAETHSDASESAAEGLETVSDDEGGGTSEAVDLGAPGIPSRTSNNLEPEDRAEEDATPPLSPSRSTTPVTTAEASTSALPQPQDDEGGPHTLTQGVGTDGAAQVPQAEVIDSVLPAEVATPSMADSLGKQPRLSTKTPNVLQKLVSMTRQRDLPPKAREEEKKHLRELDEMRTAAKEAEMRRQQALEAATAAKNARIAQAFPTWEKAILPNWRAVLQETANGRALKQLWWEGTMPVRWRGRLWGLCIGNGLAVSKASFATHLARARSALENGKYPPELVTALEQDVIDTLPTLKLFQKDGVMHDDLFDVLLAYVSYQASETLQPPRYPSGLSCPAAMLLVNMSPADAWVALCNLIHKSCLKSFYNADEEELEAYFRIFDTLLADSMPRIYENFSKEIIRPKLYLYPWLISLYVRFLPLDLATRIFDVFLLEGDSFLFRVALCLLQILEPRLFNPDQSELAAVFSGKDRGAVLIVKRQKQIPSDVDSSIEVEDVYTEMGCTEAAVFSCLEALDWREETYQRLTARELPEMD